MQTVSSRTWIQVTDSISYDNNHYVKHAIISEFDSHWVSHTSKISK